MSGRERGKQLFADLATKVRKEAAPSGEPLLHNKGQQAVADLMADLTGPEGPPGLRAFRDTPDKFRLQRQGKNAQIAVEWQRAIGAIVVLVERGERRDPEVRYLLNETDDEWRRMGGTGEIYQDLSNWLTELMYPEARR
jgi:hypothetical protein